MKLTLPVFYSLLAFAQASPLLGCSRSSTVPSPTTSSSSSSSSASSTWTNTCGPPCDDMCTCDCQGHINCHGNPWMCYESCCRLE